MIKSDCTVGYRYELTPDYKTTYLPYDIIYDVATLEYLLHPIYSAFRTLHHFPLILVCQARI